MRFYLVNKFPITLCLSREESQNTHRAHVDLEKCTSLADDNMEHADTDNPVETFSQFKRVLCRNLGSSSEYVCLYILKIKSR